jgi:allantoin racemase
MVMKKTIKILDLFPNIWMEEFKEDLVDRQNLSNQIEEATGGMVKLETVFVDKGNASIENMYDDYVVAPYILQKVKWAEKNGFDAVVIDCFLDPALDAARELVQIPIFGPCQSSTSLAVRLGGRFSVIGILDDLDRAIRGNVAKYGLSEKLVSIPVINVPVLDLVKQHDQVVQKAVETIEKIVRIDGAYAVVFGCTGMSPIIGSVQEQLHGRGINIPVIEPLRAAVYDAIACTMMGVSHSKVAYKPVREKYRVLDWEM